MNIYLKVLLAIVSFYIPGVLLLLGAVALGYTLEEVRDQIAVLGILLGVALAGCIFTD